MRIYEMNDYRNVIMKRKKILIERITELIKRRIH